MSYSYSENVLVQGAAGDLLHDELGWELVYAHNRETLGANGTLGRTDYHQVLLTKYLRPALFRLNSWMTEAYADSVVKSLMETSFSATPMQTNEQKYRLITGGVPVNFRLPNGNMETRMARLIDFDNPANDHFLAVKEMKIDGALYHRRADIIGFVNGIPLLFVEFKKLGVDVRQAYDTNYHDYQHTIPQLFWFNAFVMLSNGVESKIGTLGSKYEYFSEWKRLNEGEQGVVSLETMLRGICKKETFLDLLENFIIYDHSDNHTAKILARNHQYLGVNEAIEAYRDRKLRDGKLGVFWHTQGSGKSYSMVFLAQKIRRKFSGSPTIIVLTDRDELNKQISATFESCGCLNGMKSSTFVPSSGARLVEMLKGNPSYIFTLIQKFNNDHPDPITPNHDIIIMSDEAHRTQNGLFADNMMKLLPTASRIGFKTCFHDERNTGQQAILSLAAPLLLCLCAMLFLFSAETANPCKHNHRNRHEIHHINRDFPPCRAIVCHADVHGIRVNHRVENVLHALAKDLHVHRVGCVAPVRLNNVRQRHVVAQIQVAACICHLPQIHVGGRIEIGDDHALEAPFVPQDLSQQPIIAACPARTDAVEGAHHCCGMPFLDRDFKRAQVQFAHCLFRHPSARTVGGTMRFLFVERKVLHEAVNALAGASADFRRRHFAVEQSVFGKILEIATAEGASVDIDAGRIPAGIRQIVALSIRANQSFRAYHFADVFHQLLIPCRSHDDFRTVIAALPVDAAAIHEVREASRAICVVRGRLANDGQFIRFECAHVAHFHHVLDRQLVQNRIPARVIIRHSLILPIFIRQQVAKHQ